jgi:hypothetical protein
MSKLSTLPLRVFPALALASLTVAASLAAVTSCTGAVAAALDSTGAPAAATPAETAPAPNLFAGLKPAFT